MQFFMFYFFMFNFSICHFQQKNKEILNKVTYNIIDNFTEKESV